MNRPVPEPDPVAYARMKYELENRPQRNVMSDVWGMFTQHPDTSMAAKSGSPSMTGLRPTIPASVPASAAGTQGVSAEVSASVHGIGANLYFQGSCALTHYSSMQRLIPIRLGVGDEIIKLVRQWMPQIVDSTQGAITIRHTINQYSKGEKVMYVVKVLSQGGVLLCFLVYAVDVLGSA